MNGSGSLYVSESVWNTGFDSPGWSFTDNGYWGSGGGISTQYSIPLWQKGVNMAKNQGSRFRRNIPDISMVATDVWVNYHDLDKTNGVFMGTSIAAPLWAGFTALINQFAETRHRSSVGFVNPAIYKIGNGRKYSLFAFHDITSGNNTNASSQNNLFAVQGYDLAQDGELRLAGI